MKEVKFPASLVKNGKAAYEKKEYLEAATLFEAASQGYLAADDRLNSAEMLNNSSVAYLQANRPEEALQAVEGTEQIFAEAGDLRRQGIALGNRAAALEKLDRLDAAFQAYEQSAELLQAAGEVELRLNVMQALSTLQLRTGKQLQAVASLHAGLSAVKKPSLKQKLLKRLLEAPEHLLKR